MNPKRVIFNSVITYFVKLMSKNQQKDYFLILTKSFISLEGSIQQFVWKKRQYSNNNTITEVIKIARPVQCKTSFKCVLSRQTCYQQKSGDLNSPWNPCRGGRRELMPQSCPLTSAHTAMHISTHTLWTHKAVAINISKAPFQK